ncbi:hypothetical protein IFM89_037009 [Coptis chinensis]|uniref:Fe2OG dioxygenase domain-containing protein n=1 Tax=Coptis chinensis TaxID=261450 RepID=A0A835HSM6_9MAGN|nr:hypothetical protein IFM89_037009 [Coptis chinensis]
MIRQILKGGFRHCQGRKESTFGLQVLRGREGIVYLIYSLEEKGRNGELRDGREPGILRDEHVDPIPPLFKVIIRRLVGWHILPPTCVPDSCIVNIYDEGDCIPPHIDHHDFVQPFCTVSFLSECNIVFGTTLKPLGPGDFGGSAAIPLPVGSVLVLKGNGVDVAKHCVPAVPTRRISITFRKMAESKCPLGFVPEPDLQGLQPLPYDVDESNVMNPPKSPPLMNRHPVRQVDYDNRREFSSRGNRSESRYFGQRLQPLPYDVDESNVMYPPKSPPLVNRQPVRQVVSENGRGFSGRGNYSEPRYFGQTRSHPEGRRRMRVSLGT